MSEISTITSVTTSEGIDANTKEAATENTTKISLSKIKETRSKSLSKALSEERSDSKVSPFTRLKVFWDWVDDRDIDKHAVSLAILYGTMSIVNWAMVFASMNPGKPGIEIAAIIAAVSAPYMALQSFALKYYFNARS
jgi:hypothetical protein